MENFHGASFLKYNKNNVYKTSEIIFSGLNKRPLSLPNQKFAHSKGRSLDSLKF